MVMDCYAPELFVAGAGAYVHAYVLPALRGVIRHTVVDINPLLAAMTAHRFGFRNAEASLEISARRLAEVDSPIFVIATYHSTHVAAAEAVFSENPRTKIFIEKPPVTNFRDLNRLLALRAAGAWIEVGYNRRFSPLISRARALVERETGPILMFCLVKELPLPSNHWYYWPTQGTRITGNLCHWVDLGVYIIDSEAVRVEAESAPGARPGDEVSATVYFADGSKLVLLATDRGNALRGVQEYINIRRGDLTISIDDFLRMEILVGGRSRRHQWLFRDKGHRRMYNAFWRAVVAGGSPSYPDEALRRSSELYLRIRDAVLAGNRL
jgi:predicted dehydrogenase